MPPSSTISDFFEIDLGASLRNPRWSWGALNKESGNLFLRVWDDQHLEIDGRDCVMLMGPHWGGPGASERLQHIEEIRKGAPTFAVFCAAKDPSIRERSIGGFDPSSLARLGNVLEVGGVTYGEIAEYVDFHDIRHKVEKNSAPRWTPVELKACTDAYLEMLDAEKRGETFSKSAFNQRLRDGALSLRSRSSIEYRMRNISAVLGEFGLSWIKGYFPARNIGPGGRKELIDLLGLQDYEETNDQATLERRAASLTKTAFDSPPKGTLRPMKSMCTSAAFMRSPAVRSFVLKMANGSCELCSKPAPFVDRKNDPFLELHHVVPLADGGSDTPSNSVALCPNCHRRCHHAIDCIAVRDMLYQRVSRLERLAPFDSIEAGERAEE